MANSVGGIFVSMAAGIARFKQDMAQAKNIARSTGSSMSNSFSKTSKQTAAFTKQLQIMKSQVLGLGAAYLTLNSAKQAIKTFADFQSGMTAVNTILRVTPERLAELSDAAREAAMAVGETPGGFAEAMYQAVSAGVDATRVIEFTTAAAKLAKAGFTDTTTAVDLLSTTINAYGEEAGDLNHVLDVLLNTQNRGKTTIGRLAESMGQAIPTAAALGVNFDVLTAALQAMTANGIDTATSVTSIRALLVALAGPTDEMKKKYEELGIQWSESRLRGDGLVDLLKEIFDKSQGSVEVLGDLGINQRSLNAALTLGGKRFDFFTESIKSNNDAVEVLNESFGMVSKDVQFNLDQMSSAFDNLAIAVVSGFGPAITKAIQLLTDLAKAASGSEIGRIPTDEEQIERTSALLNETTMRYQELQRVIKNLSGMRVLSPASKKRLSEYKKEAEELVFTIDGLQQILVSLTDKVSASADAENQAAEINTELAKSESALVPEMQAVNEKYIERITWLGEVEKRLKKIREEQEKNSNIDWIMRTSGLNKDTETEDTEDPELKAWKSRLSAAQEYTSAAMNLADQLTAYEQAKIQARLTSQLSAVDKWYSAQVASANATITDEEALSTRLAEIEEQYQNKVSNLKDKAARDEEAAAAKFKWVKYAQAITNTAVAVTEALPNLVFAGLVATAGAAEIATIKAQPYAKGGVVNAPYMFPTSSGMALAGEAGPEAILPLARTATGDLGVQTAGGGGGAKVYVSLTLQGNVLSDAYIVDTVAPTIETAVRKGLSKIQVKN